MARPQRIGSVSIVHVERILTSPTPIAARRGTIAPLGPIFLLTAQPHLTRDVRTAKKESIRQMKTASTVSNGRIVYLENMYILPQPLSIGFVNHVLMEDIPC